MVLSGLDLVDVTNVTLVDGPPLNTRRSIGFSARPDGTVWVFPPAPVAHYTYSL